MDIFSKIDDEQQTMSRVGKFDIIEVDGRYGYAFVRDESKIDTEFCDYFRPDKSKKCTQKGFWQDKKASRFYKFLTKPKKQYKNPEKQAKAQKKRMQKLRAKLEKGINIYNYFTLGMDKTLLATLPEEEIKLLYEFGYDVMHTLDQCVDIDCYRKNIFFALENFNDTSILKNMSASILETVIHTRNGLNLTKGTIDNLLSGGTYCYYNRVLIENLQILIKTGQITCTPEQIKILCAEANKNNMTILPEVQAIYDKLKVEGKLPETKFSTQKQISQSSHRSSKTSKQSEAQEMIDKLFEDAQNSIE